MRGEIVKRPTSQVIEQYADRLQKLKRTTQGDRTFINYKIIYTKVYEFLLQYHMKPDITKKRREINI
jgi:hypothetical protein